MGIFYRGLHPFLDKCKTSLKIVERSIQLCLQDLYYIRLKGTYYIATEGLRANLTLEILDLLMNISYVSFHILLPFKHEITQCAWKFLVDCMGKSYMVS